MKASIIPREEGIHRVSPPLPPRNFDPTPGKYLKYTESSCTVNQIQRRSDCVFFETQKTRSVETHEIFAIYMFLKLCDEYGYHRKYVNPILFTIFGSFLLFSSE